jgi:hypothetical protein
VLVVVLVLENPDRFAIRLTEQISCRTSVSLRSRNPNAPRTSTTTRARTIPNSEFGFNPTPVQALALSEMRLFPISLTRSSPYSDVRCRIARETYRRIGVSAFAKHHQLRRDLLVLQPRRKAVLLPRTPIRQHADPPTRSPSTAVLFIPEKRAEPSRSSLHH